MKTTFGQQKAILLIVIPLILSLVLLIPMAGASGMQMDPTATPAVEPTPSEPFSDSSSTCATTGTCVTGSGTMGSGSTGDCPMMSGDLTGMGGMSGMSGMNGMSGMSGMTGMTGMGSMSMQGMSGMTASGNMLMGSTSTSLWNQNPWFILGWVLLGLVLLAAVAGIVVGTVWLIRRSRPTPSS